MTGVRELPYGRVFNWWSSRWMTGRTAAGQPLVGQRARRGAGYFSTLGIAVREGRVFDAADLRGRRRWR